MADMNIPANDAPAEQAHAVTPPTRTDDQIFSSRKWVPIGKSKCVLYAKTPCASDSLGKNLATASREKKKTTRLFIPNVRFTKLIIHHLKTKHNIHPRTGLPLHYSHDENNLNTLSTYYDEYQEHVAKYQQYLDAEHGKAEEGGGTKSLKASKGTKPKAAKAIKPVGDKASTHTSTQPPKLKPAPTHPSKDVPEKKQNLVKDTPDEPSPAKRSKGGLVGKYVSLEAHSSWLMNLVLKMFQLRNLRIMRKKKTFNGL
nr:hypothetical protein [Tanacetum cinerariifolium]